MRIIVSFLLALLLLLSAAACSVSDTAAETTPVRTDVPAGTEAVTESAATADPARLAPDFQEKDYGGATFTFMQTLFGWSNFNNEKFIVEEENGSLLNDAIYARNRKVEELFNVKFAETDISQNDSVVVQLQKFVAAGDNSVDVYLSTGNPRLGPEYCCDFTLLESINLDRVWWDRNYFTNNSVGGKLCSMVSSMQITRIEACITALFNKKIASDHGIRDSEIYQLVRDGKWTLDRFLGYCKSVTTDLDGNGIWDIGDLYGVTAQNGMARVGSGTAITAVVKDAKDMPVLSLDDTVFVEKLMKLTELGEQFRTEIQDAAGGKDIPQGGSLNTVFKEDHALFWIHGFGSVNQFREMDSDFGVIPTPKYDEGQKDYSILVSNDANKHMLLNATIPDREKTGLVLEALSYYGWLDLIPQFYETFLQSRFLRDRESVEIMDDYILPDLFYSPCFGSATLYKMTTTILSGESPVASTIASNREKIESEIADYVKQYK